MKVEILSCQGADARRWQGMWERLPHRLRDVHHTPTYARLQDPKAFCALMEGDEQVVLLPLVPLVGGVSVGQPYGFGGPIGTAYAPGLLREFATQLDEHLGRVGGWQSEHCTLVPCLADEQLRMVRAMGWVHHQSPKEVALIDVTSDDAHILAGMTPKRAQMVERAVRAGIEAEAYDPQPVDWTELGLAYSKMVDRHDAGERWDRTISYFRRHDWLGTEHKVMVHSCGTGPGAYALLLLSRRVAYYHYAARLDGTPPGAAEMVILECCRAARRAGCQWLHLGGGTTIDNQDSLWKFKSSFSPYRAPVWRYDRVIGAAP